MRTIFLRLGQLSRTLRNEVHEVDKGAKIWGRGPKVQRNGNEIT